MPPALAALTTPDTIVLIVLLVLGIRGAIKGFAWQALRTVGLVGALWGATNWYRPVSGWVKQRIELVPEVMAPVVAWLLIVVGIFLVFTYLAYLARGLVRSVNLTAPDRLLGFALGGVMALVFCALGFITWGHLIVGKDELRDTLAGSISARYMAKTIEVLEPLFPGEVRERFGEARSALDEAAGGVRSRRVTSTCGSLDARPRTAFGSSSRRLRPASPPLRQLAASPRRSAPGPAVMVADGGTLPSPQRPDRLRTGPDPACERNPVVGWHLAPARGVNAHGRGQSSTVS